MLYDFMTGLYPSIRFLWFWSFVIDRITLHCVIQCVKEIKNHSVQTVSDKIQKSNVEIVNYVNGKRDQKAKRNKT